MRSTVCHCRRESRLTIHDFINEAIHQVREGGETISAVAERLGLRPSLIRQWLLPQYPLERSGSRNEVIDALKQENDALRRECHRLRNITLSLIAIDEQSQQEQL